MTTDLTGATDETGSRGDWVELYNTTASRVDLTGWGLSNATKSPFRWVFPSGTSIAAKGYLRVWADKADRTASATKLHTNFNLDNGVDSVVLSAPNGTATGVVADSTTPPRTKPDVSWCRLPNGVASSAFASCLTPTPTAANSGATAGALLATPVLSLASGVYTSAQTVSATGPAGATLRYTTDGSAPTATSAQLTGALTVSSSTVVRVGAFATGLLPSYVATGTYVIDTAGRYSGQRLVFVTMKPADRNSFTSGGTTSVGWQSAVEMIAPTGTSAFKADAMTEQAGQLGSRNGQKTLPLEINFKDAAGVKDISYPIFSAKPTQTKYKKLRLRNSGDDYQEAHLRDQFWQAVGTEAKLVPAASEPTQVFLNGAYYGMMDLREKEDETLLESTYGVDKDDTEYLSDGSIVKGDNAKTDFNAVSKFITGNDMSVAANYAKATSLLDVENFAQDFALHMFAADRDWQWRNMHAFKMPSYDGKWRYRVHDVDISADGTNAWGMDTTTDVNMNDKYTGYTSGAMMRALLKNPTFKNLYANVIADQLNTFLAPANSTALLNSTAAAMAPYMPAHIAKNGQPTSVATWNAQVARLRTFLTQRSTYYLANTRTYLGVGAFAPVTVGVADLATGTVKVNTVDLTSRLTETSPTWTGSYFANVPVTVTAVPKPGYVFAGWTGTTTSSDRTITVLPSAATTLTATFFSTATVAAPSVSTPAAQTATTGSLVSLPMSATDANGLAVTWSAKSLPSGLDITPATGMIYGKPTKAGTFSSTISATNGKATTKTPITWTITNALDRVVTLPTTITGDGIGLKAEYSADATLSGTSATSRVENPAISLSATAAPVTGYPSSNWSVRWTGTVTVPAAGDYTLQALQRADDGSRVFVNGTKVLDAWTTGATAPTATVSLKANEPTPIVVEFYDKTGAASFALQWKLPGRTDYVPVAQGVLNP